MCDSITEMFYRAPGPKILPAFFLSFNELFIKLFNIFAIHSFLRFFEMLIKLLVKNSILQRILIVLDIFVSF